MTRSYSGDTINEEPIINENQKDCQLNCKPTLSQCCGAKIWGIKGISALYDGCSICGKPFIPANEEESVNFLQVGDSHCFKCHKTFPPDFGKPPHTLECKGEIKPCKDWDGKTCEFSTETPDWMQEEREAFYLWDKKSPTYIHSIDETITYWLTRMVEQSLKDKETYLKAYKSGTEKAREQSRAEERHRIFEIIEAHAKQNTYEDEEALVYKTTVREIIDLLNNLK